MTNRTIIIGLDGFSYSLLVKFSKHLNFLGRLAGQGVSGAMQTTIPPLSPPAWASLTTGLNPGKHGIYGFTREVGEYEFVLSDSHLLRGKAVWDVAGLYGKRVIVVNVPMTYPAYPVNGIMVSGLPALSTSKAFYPRTLLDDLRSNVGDYIFDIDVGSEYSIEDVEAFVDNTKRITKQRMNAIAYLMEQYEWDLVFGVLTGPDRINHVFWKYVVEEYDYPHTDSLRESKDMFLGYYIFLDRLLESMLRGYSKHDNVAIILVSDHGFEEVHTFLGLTNILKSLGYLKSSAFPLTKEKIWHIVLKSPRLFYRVKRLLPKHLLYFQRMMPSSLDKTRSIAYCSNACGISLMNAKFRSEIVAKLQGLIDPESDGTMVDKIYSKEGIYHGSFLDEAPDLILQLKEGYECKREVPRIVCSIGDVAPLSRKTGTHQGMKAVSDALFVAYGAPVRRDVELTDNVSVYDIAPTILFTLGLPIPKSADGRVLKEIFKEDSEAARRSIKHSDLEEGIGEVRGKPGAREKSEQEYSTEEEEEIKKRLQGLGYL